MWRFKRHTHTHTCTHARMTTDRHNPQTHTHAHTCKRDRTHIHSTYAHKQQHTLKCTCICMHKCTHTHTHTHTLRQTIIEIYVVAQKRLSKAALRSDAATTRLVMDGISSKVLTHTLHWLPLHFACVCVCVCVCVRALINMKPATLTQ